MNNIHILVIILLIIYIILPKGYISFYPSLIPIYPNNKKEVIILKKYINNRTRDDVSFFHLTNRSVVPAFVKHVDETSQELDKIVYTNLNYIIIRFFKYSINRPRPCQIDNTIIPINIDTAQTPAYPAGHAFQAYFLAKVLSKKYPIKKCLFEKIAKDCDMTRVKAGLHYPSDGEFSKKLVDFFYY